LPGPRACVGYLLAKYPDEPGPWWPLIGTTNFFGKGAQSTKMAAFLFLL